MKHFLILTGALLALHGTGHTTSVPPQAQTSPIHVTAGKLLSKAAHVSGYAEIIEKGGKRFLVLSHLVAPKCHVLLVKLENITDDKSVKAAMKLDLGPTGNSGSLTFPLSKEIDVWLYRSVSLWNPKSGRNLGIAALRSDQEKP